MTGAHNATLNGGVTWTQDPTHGMTATFNGSTGYFATATPVITTNSSYTVSAWVKLGNTSSQHTILSQNGSDRSPFYLQYDDGSNKWRLYVSSADVSSPTWYNAQSTSTPQVGVWTQLTGVYDSSAQTIKLYVNGALQGSASGVTTWNSTGVTWIGRSLTTFFAGGISDVQIYNRALTSAEATNLYGTGTVTGDAVALAGPLETQAVFSGTGGGASTTTSFTYDPNLGTAAESPVGPGSVNDVTGNFALSSADAAVSSWNSNVEADRTFNSRQPNVYDSTHMFGPGWTSSAQVGTATPPYTKLTVAGTLVQVGLPDGTSIGFTAKSGGGFVPQVGQETSTLTYTSTGDTYTLADNAGNVVVFGHIGSVAGFYTPISVTEPGSAETSTMTWQSTTVDGAPVVRPTQILAPVPTGVTCTTLVKGCRALGFTYATSTTATGTTQATWGSYTGRLSGITFTAWDPSTSAMTTVVVAGYLYDNLGRLTAAWDPRLDNGAAHLWTTYAYNADGTIATITPNTQPAWTLTYTTVPGDLGVGRLASVSRSALTAGTATTTVVYRVPTSGTGAPYDMSKAQTSRWDEQAPPTQATAVFDAGQVPTGSQSAGTMPSSWTRATVTYMDANSREVNVVTPGGYTTSTWFDQYGNPLRTMTANNRAEALNASTTDTAAQEALLADSLQMQYTYTPDGVDLLATVGPTHNVTLSTGAVVAGRDLSEFTYDQGAVSPCPCDLVTTSVTGTRYVDAGGVTHDTGLRTSTTSYNWSLRQPSVSTEDPAGLDLTTTTTYNADGLVASVTTPAGGSTTNTPATTDTVYYTTAANGVNPECGGHPEWANLVCRVQPGGQAASGPEIPATETTYDVYGKPKVVTESTSAGTLRTTTVTYDGEGRPLTSAVVGAAGTGTAVPTTREVYDPATATAVNVQSLDAGNNVTAQTVTQYDALGRVSSYTDTDGVQSTTSYDLLSRATVLSDGLQSTTISYDTGGENRGLATQIADAQAGTVTETYDADGNLLTEVWPNGITVTHTYNEDDTQVGILYTKTGCGQPDCTIYTQAATVADTGDLAGMTSSLSSQSYGYDTDGRMTSVKDVVAGQCATRVYGFDATAAGRASDRTSLNTYDPAVDGSCQTSTPSTTSAWTYDTADRLNTPGYVYDSLGRTTTVPAADTQVPDGGDLAVTYAVNDKVQTVTQGAGATATYVLDVDNQRIRSWVDSNGVSHTNHYAGPTDSPSWSMDNGVSTRDLAGPNGLLATVTPTGVATWQIADLDGNIVTTTTDGVSFSATSETDEFGNLRDDTQVGAVRYAYEGQNQRQADNPAGVVIMGARLYNPATGRFLSTDQVQGGNANPYDYGSGNPTTGADLTGDVWCMRWSASHKNHWWGKTIKLQVYCSFTDSNMFHMLIFGMFGSVATGIIAAILSAVFTPAVGIVAAIIGEAFSGIAVYEATWYWWHCHHSDGMWMIFESDLSFYFHVFPNYHNKLASKGCY